MRSSLASTQGNLQVHIDTFGRSTPHVAELRAMNMTVGAVVDMHNFRAIEAWASVLRSASWRSFVGAAIHCRICDSRYSGSRPLAVVKGGALQNRLCAVPGVILDERRLAVEDRSCRAALMSQLQIRLAREADLSIINEIYNHYVVNSTCTFRWSRRGWRIGRSGLATWDEHR